MVQTLGSGLPNLTFNGNTPPMLHVDFFWPWWESNGSTSSQIGPSKYYLNAPHQANVTPATQCGDFGRLWLDMITLPSQHSNLLICGIFLIPLTQTSFLFQVFFGNIDVILCTTIFQ